jgi:hypothetical protein
MSSFFLGGGGLNLSPIYLSLPWNKWRDDYLNLPRPVSHLLPRDPLHCKNG